MCITLAPALKAALASRAISSGVTGTWCCLGSVSTPFSAQVMTALSLMDEASPGQFVRSLLGATAEYRKREPCHRHLPHPEEPRDARRLEGWTTRTSILRDARQRRAPQDEGQSCWTAPASGITTASAPSAVRPRDFLS